MRPPSLVAGAAAVVSLPLSVLVVVVPASLPPPARRQRGQPLPDPPPPRRPPPRTSRRRRPRHGIRHRPPAVLKETASPWSGFDKNIAIGNAKYAKPPSMWRRTRPAPPCHNLRRSNPFPIHKTNSIRRGDCVVAAGSGVRDASPRRLRLLRSKIRGHEIDETALEQSQKGICTHFHAPFMLTISNFVNMYFK